MKLNDNKNKKVIEIKDLTINPTVIV